MQTGTFQQKRITEESRPKPLPIREQLEQRRDRLRAELDLVNGGLATLDAHPDAETIVASLSQALGGSY